MEMSPGSSQSLPPVPSDYNTALNGISGWLVYFIVAELLSGLLSVVRFILTARRIGISDFFDGWIYASIVFTVIVNVFLSALIVFFIFRRNIFFRNLYILQISLTVLFFTIQYVSIHASLHGLLFEQVFHNSFGNIRYEVSYLVSDAVEAAIWIVYLFRSKRIKNTFIYPKMQFDFSQGQSIY